MREAILRLLAEQSMHGYQMMQELEERTGGGWNPSPGSIYPSLQLLADEGLVDSTSADGKNVFSLTDAGRTAVDELEGAPVWERFEEGPNRGGGALRQAVGQLGMAAKQVGSAGSEDQVADAIAIVDDARKRIYRLLAEVD